MNFKVPGPQRIILVTFILMTSKLFHLFICIFISGFATVIHSQSCLVAHYPLDSNAVDISGNGLNGSVNGPVPTTDRFGLVNSAMFFDGIDDNIEVTSNSLFNFGTSDDFTVSCWLRFKTDQVQPGSANAVITKYDDNGTNTAGFPFSLRIYNQNSSDSGKVFAMRKEMVSCGNKPGLFSQNMFNDSIYHHYVFVKNGGDLELYMDNVMENVTTDNTSCSTDNNFKLRFGSKGGSNNSNSFYKGSIDDVMIFNCALDENEIDSLYKLTPWTGLAEMSGRREHFALYPNPNHGDFSLDLSGFQSPKVSLRILNASGSVLFERNLTPGIQVLHLSGNLSGGIYFAELSDGKEVFRQKMVVN